MRKRIVLYTLLILLILNFLTCQTGEEGQYLQKNISTFDILTLDNGIPLIIKNNEYNRIFSLFIGLQGQSMLTTKDKAGIEGVTLQMLTKGSEAYKYEDIKQILYEKSSSLRAFYSSFDYSYFSLFTLDKYFKELFPLFIDSFLNPSWNEEEFAKVIYDMKINYQQNMNDPYGRMVNILHDYTFKDHPYMAYFSGTEESLDNISLEDVKEYYKETFSPERIFVVAVGNFDTQSLYTNLNNSLGKLPKKGITIAEVPPFKELNQSELILEPFAASPGVAFVRADFHIPVRAHPDYPALMLASAMLDDLLFQIVRIQNSAAYGMWVHTFGFKANYASIVIFKTIVPEKVKHYIDNAIAVLLNGECLGAKISVSASGKGGIGETDDPEAQKGNFVPIEQALEFYKAQYINFYYHAQQTNASIASQILNSLVYTGDYKDYLYYIERINAVTTDDIIQVASKYFFEQPMTWIVLSSQDMLDKIKRQDYLTFQGKLEE